MKLVCPLCSKYTLTYSEKVYLAPRRWNSSPTVRCKHCNELLARTPKSMLVFIITMPILAFATALLFELNHVNLIFIFVFWVFIFWPFFAIRIQDSSLPEHYLPEGRLAGYGLYLGVPVLLMAIAWLLAVQFELGF